MSTLITKGVVYQSGGSGGQKIFSETIELRKPLALVGINYGCGYDTGVVAGLPDYGHLWITPDNIQKFSQSFSNNDPRLSWNMLQNPAFLTPLVMGSFSISIKLEIPVASTWFASVTMYFQDPNEI